MEVSPPQLYLVGDVRDTLCENVTIANIESDIIVVDRWVSMGYDSRNLLEYIMSSENLGLNVSYDDDFFINEKTKQLVCVNGAKSGLYYGVLLYMANGENSGVGIWVQVNLSESENIELNREVMSPQVDFSGALVVILIFLFCFLLVVFCFLLSTELIVNFIKRNVSI